MSTTLVSAHALTDVERDVIDFFAYIAPTYRTKTPGLILSDVREYLGLDMTRAAQILVHAIEKPAAFHYDGPAVARLHRERAQRSAARLPRRRLADAAAAAAEDAA